MKTIIEFKDELRAPLVMRDVAPSINVDGWDVDLIDLDSTVKGETEPLAFVKRIIFEP